MKTLRSLPLVLIYLSAVALGAPSFDWPQWRGPDHTGVSKEIGLLKAWPADGPKQVWLYQNAGHGFSAPAIVGGKYYTLGTRDSSEILLVLNAETGAELWTASLSPKQDIDRGPGARGTPTIDGDRVYALTGNGHLVCVNTADHKIVWKVTMDSLGGRIPHWGYAESPLVDGDQVVCTPGGAKGAVAAFDKMTGKLRWQSKDFTDPAHYSSIVPARINNTAQYVQRSVKSVVGIAPQTGKLLWETDFPGRTAVVPTPIIKGDEVYVTAGYGAGCKMVRIGAGNKVTVVYENNKVMKNHHGGVILLGDHLYGFSDDNGWTCQDFKTGQQVWAHKGVGKGAVAYADGMLYCLGERDGTVALVEASPSEWREHGRFKLSPSTTIRDPKALIWTHPVISNGKLYLRDQDIIYCYDVKGRSDS
jgi:outer membrane protein assembly factor BamB